MRGLNAFAGILFFLTGIIGTAITWCVVGPAGWDPNGFTVLMGVGAFMVAADLWVERGQHEKARSRPRYETDRDHMEVW